MRRAGGLTAAYELSNLHVPSTVLERDPRRIGRAAHLRPVVNQDHSVLTAPLAARNIGGAEHDVWAVNMDLEYQEEIRLPSVQADGP